MSELRAKLLTAYSSGDFLQAASDFSRGAQEHTEHVIESMSALHNEGAIDLIAEFKKLRRQGSGPDFFLTRNSFEKTLPYLNAPLQNVMDCVAHLSAEAGQDMAANWIFASFIDYCAAEEARIRSRMFNFGVRSRVKPRE